MNIKDIPLVYINCDSVTSSGIHFQSPQNDRSFVLTCKHAICMDFRSCYSEAEAKKEQCRGCPSYNIDQKSITLTKNGSEVLTVKSAWATVERDLALIEVTEVLSTKIVNNHNISENSEYIVVKANSNIDSEVSRLILNNCNKYDESVIRANVKSSTLSEGQIKSEVLPGYSGSPVFDDKFEAITGVLTDNQTENDVEFELLTPSTIESLEQLSGTQLFSKKSMLVNNVDSKFMEFFDEIDEVNISNGGRVRVYCLRSSGNEFNVEPLIQYIFDKLLVKFSTREPDPESENLSSSFAALNLFNQYQSTLKTSELMLHGLIESVLKAPKFFSFIDNENCFNGVHVLDVEDKVFRFIYGVLSIKETIKKALDQAFEFINMNPPNVDSVLLNYEPTNLKNYNMQQKDIIEKLILPKKDDYDYDYEIGFAVLAKYVFDVNESIRKEPRMGVKRKLIKDKICQDIKVCIEDIEKQISDKNSSNALIEVFVLPINFINQFEDEMSKKISSRIGELSGVRRNG